MPKTMNASHYATEKYEVQRTNQWEIQIVGLSEDFTLCVTRTGFPERTLEIIEVPHMNGVTKVAGGQTYSDLSLDINDTIGADIQRAIDDWQNIAMTKEGKMGYTSEYKKVAYLTKYDPKGEIERTFKLKGCWPTTVNYGEGDYSAKDKMVINMTLAYDDFELI